MRDPDWTLPTFVMVTFVASVLFVSSWNARDRLERIENDGRRTNAEVAQIVEQTVHEVDCRVEQDLREALYEIPDAALPLPRIDCPIQLTEEKSP